MVVPSRNSFEIIFHNWYTTLIKLNSFHTVAQEEAVRIWEAYRLIGVLEFRDLANSPSPISDCLEHESGASSSNFC